MWFCQFNMEEFSKRTRDIQTIIDRSESSKATASQINQVEGVKDIESVIFANQEDPTGKRRCFIAQNPRLLSHFVCNGIKPGVFPYSIHGTKSTSRTPKPFHKFPDFPQEIQIRIWEFAIANLPTQVFACNSYPPFTPSLLQVCKLSREETLKTYYAILHPWCTTLRSPYRVLRRRPNFYINPKTDIFLLRFDLIKIRHYRGLFTHPKILKFPDENLPPFYDESTLRPKFDFYSRLCSRFALDIVDDFYDGRIFLSQEIFVLLLHLRYCRPRVREFVLICKGRGDYHVASEFKSWGGDQAFGPEGKYREAWYMFEEFQRFEPFEGVGLKLVEYIEGGEDVVGK